MSHYELAKGVENMRKALINLFFLAFSTCSLPAAAGEFPCNSNVGGQGSGLCATPIISGVAVNFSGWPGDLLNPNRFPDVKSAVAAYNAAYCQGAVTPLPGTYADYGMRATWDFAVTHVYGLNPGSCDTNPIDIYVSVIYSCPTGFREYDPYSTPSGIPPSTTNGFPCFQPNPQIFCGCAAGDPIKILENSTMETEYDYQPGTDGHLDFIRSYRSFGSASPNQIGANWTHNFATWIAPAPYGQSGVTLTKGNDDPQFFSLDAQSNLVAPIGDRDRLVAITGASPGWLYYDSVSMSVKVFDVNGRMTGETFVNGSKLLFIYSTASTPASIAPTAGLLITVTNDAGRSINLTYDQSGFIKTFNDPAGLPITYNYYTELFYTALQDLSGVTYQDNSARSYAYLVPTSALPGAGVSQVNQMTSITDELGTALANFTYSSSAGRSNATASQQAGGVNHFQFDIYASTGQGAYTDPLGTRKTMSASAIWTGVQLKWLPQNVSQPSGSGSNSAVESNSYDSNGNITVRDNLNGFRSCFANDLTRNLALAEVDGLVRTTSCGDVTGANAALPLGSRKISTMWHPDWSLVVKRAGPGLLTTYVYNGQPDSFNGGAIASCAPASAVLPDAKPVVVLCKQVEQATTDGDGHLGFSAALQSGVANRVQTWTYNASGQVLTAKGARTDVNDTTTYVYYSSTTANYAKGDLQQVTTAASQVTQFPSYNKHGQVLRKIDSNSVITDYTYDLRLRLLSATVGGLQTSYMYDAAGQLKKVTQPDTTVINYVYDAAHRLTQVTDQAGNSVTYTLDNAGNRTKEDTKNSSGTLARTVARAFDALSRVQSVTGAMQ